VQTRSTTAEGDSCDLADDETPQQERTQQTEHSRQKQHHDHEQMEKRRQGLEYIQKHYESWRPFLSVCDTFWHATEARQHRTRSQSCPAVCLRASKIDAQVPPPIERDDLKPGEIVVDYESVRSRPKVRMAIVRCKVRAEKLLRPGSSEKGAQTNWVTLELTTGEVRMVCKACIEIAACVTRGSHGGSSFGASGGNATAIVRLAKLSTDDFPEVEVKISVGGGDREKSFGPQEFKCVGVKPSFQLAGAVWNLNDAQERSNNKRYVTIVAEITPKNSP